MRDPRYDILFTPVKIGPVTAKNRFFQVPHCNGFGYRDPTAGAVMRGIKAEGGWAVVCTEQADVHHSSDITPFIEQHLWDDRDMPAAKQILRAAAFTYVAAAAMSLLDIARWFRVLRM